MFRTELGSMDKLPAPFQARIAELVGAYSFGHVLHEEVHQETVDRQATVEELRACRKVLAEGPDELVPFGGFLLSEYCQYLLNQLSR